jgi:hypothetical protein
MSLICNDIAALTSVLLPGLLRDGGKGLLEDKVRLLALASLAIGISSTGDTSESSSASGVGAASKSMFEEFDAVSYYDKNVKKPIKKAFLLGFYNWLRIACGSSFC